MVILPRNQRSFTRLGVVHRGDSESWIKKKIELESEATVSAAPEPRSVSSRTETVPTENPPTSESRSVSSRTETVENPLVEKIPSKTETANISPPPPPKTETTKPTSSRPKSTLNLNAILKAKELAPETLPQIVEPVDVKPLTDDQVREAWTDIANQRINQQAGLQSLSRT